MHTAYDHHMMILDNIHDTADTGILTVGFWRVTILLAYYAFI